MATGEDNYNSGAFKSYQRHKTYKQKVEDAERKKTLVTKRYFACLECGKINEIDDILNEESENRTTRTKYLTWKKLKGLANDLNGNIEDALNYLLFLHERKIENKGRDDYEVNVAANFGNENNKK